jgi:hypothetical protein
MLFLRILGKGLLFIAFLALAYDGARILASPGEGLLLTSLGAHLKTHFPAVHEGIRQFFLGFLPSFVFTSLIEPMLILPLSIVCTVIGTLCFLGGYRRPPPEIVGD